MGVGRAYVHPGRWIALRQQALRRDDFKCVQCGARGRLEVDHIQPVITHPQLTYELSNLQSLCTKCHINKTLVDRGCAPISIERQRWRDFINQEK